MENIKIRIHDTLSFYESLKGLPLAEQQRKFRFELMYPFKTMWDYLGVPLEGKTEHAYDVIMASSMLGIWTPSQVNDEMLGEKINLLKETCVFTEAKAVIEAGLKSFKKMGYSPQLSEIDVGILLGDETNHNLQASLGYSGFGGIPGYILLFVAPNEFNKTRLNSALAHEFNHNIRFSFEPFNHGNVSVGEYLVMEGLAEQFAVALYGEENRGPWVTDYAPTEMAKIKKIVEAGLDVKGFNEVRAYMYGDDVALEQGYQAVGLPRNAGYTVGYYLVEAYMKQTGKTIFEATLTPSQEILEKSHFFSEVVEL